MRCRNFILLIFSGAVLAGCASGLPPAAESPPVVLGRGTCVSKGKTCSLEFVWVEGGRYEDTNLWCGSGEKYEGKFVFRAKISGGESVDTPASDEAGDFFFIHEHQPWGIQMGDYNRDGQPDFNIVWYGGCNRDLCMLYTILPSGKVEPLKMQSREGEITDAQIAVPRGGPSASDLQLTPAGFCQLVDDASEFYDWNPAKKLFRYKEQKTLGR